MAVTPIRMPEVSQEVLDMFTAVRVAYPAAILAGGALRDAYFGVSIKDVDVFVGPSFDPAKMSGWHVYEQFPASLIASYREHFGPRVTAVFCAYPHCGVSTADQDEILSDVSQPPLQIIQCDRDYSIPDLLDDFDWGFCQIATDDLDAYRDMAWVSQQFLRDAEGNTATNMLRPDDPRLWRSIERGHRLSGKYPDRRFMVPLMTHVTRIEEWQPHRAAADTSSRGSL